MSNDLILGTAGHIDHGKSTLIKCLTGVDTDRLPEEKRRGITIELGFAELTVADYRLGIVDVPGHERFVRQMLAGATGMDLALLVVAANDSVKPQTREHFDVLKLLDLRAGVIALTKCDLADPDWIALVEEEVSELVRGSFLETAPIVRTSATDGDGIEDLKLALEQAAALVADETRQRRTAPFRMAIDRSFTVVGHGTVVTGSVATGRVNQGEHMMIEPGSIEVRVRGLHNHDREVQEIWAGQRAAINLAGVRHEELGRGHELSAAGHLQSSKLISAQVNMLGTAPRPLRQRDRVRLHIGTAEVLASVVPLGTDRLNPGACGVIQAFLQEPIVSTWHQPFVVRAESPVETIAGGRVLVPQATKIRRATDEILQQFQNLSATDPLLRAAAAIYFAGAVPEQTLDLARMAGADAEHDYAAQLIAARKVVAISTSGTRKVLIHHARIAEYGERVVSVLAKLHDANPLQTMFDRSAVATQFLYLGDPMVVDAVLSHLAAAGRLRLSSRGVGLADRGPKLSKGERELLKQIVEQFRVAEFRPPSIKECEQQAQKNQKSVRSLVALAASDGELVEFGNQLFLHADVEATLRHRVFEAFQGNPELTVSEIRELLDTSRKFAVPMCLYLDRIGFTRRDGDIRRLSPTQR